MTRFIRIVLFTLLIATIVFFGFRSGQPFINSLGQTSIETPPKDDTNRSTSDESPPVTIEGSAIPTDLAKSSEENNPDSEIISDAEGSIGEKATNPEKSELDSNKKTDKTQKDKDVEEDTPEKEKEGRMRPIRPNY